MFDPFRPLSRWPGPKIRALLTDLWRGTGEVFSKEKQARLLLLLRRPGPELYHTNTLCIRTNNSSEHQTENTYPTDNSTHSLPLRLRTFHKQLLPLHLAVLRLDTVTCTHASKFMLFVGKADESEFIGVQTRSLRHSFFSSHVHDLSVIITTTSWALPLTGRPGTLTEEH